MSHPFKFTAPTDKLPGAWHGAYLPVYEKLFYRPWGTTQLRDSDESILEIGVDGAGSLLMYAAYFRFAKAFGMDIQTKPNSLDSNDRVTFIQGDAYTMASVEMFSKLGPFAWIVDDGSHTLESQMMFCRHYAPLLSDEGVACVEDVQDANHFQALAAVLPKEFFGYGIDLRMHDGRYDNLLFVIQRR